ncbi:uncharacterized protein M6B38_274745 [Iris pallida]|uniref:Uncharacterized protein n=1 Tax=Iris pallida TaxID=29817 RepID=A0AAX6I5M3_IRIPA|nr:uncharacterized protein M6B38_274745 [Iris pallida]
MDSEKRGSISFFSTYRPPVALDIFSCVASQTPKGDQVLLTDGRSYNYNGRVIPPAALKHPKLMANCEGEEAGVKSGPQSGMVFVSERTGLETLHIALYSEENLSGKVRVIGLQHLFPDTFSGVRMEDSGCFVAGDSLVYVSTKEPAAERRQPWTAVYSTHLGTGETKRLTPPGVADLSPSVSPSGKKIAVASFQGKTGGWDGEIEDLQTNIYVMDVANPSDRKLVVTNGGWPTWGSDDVLFFHRKDKKFWGVFRVDIRNLAITPVTPAGFSAMTPAAIDATRVAVATIRQTSSFSDVRVKDQYRHIEIFDSTNLSKPSEEITQSVRPLADHFNPFVIDGGKRIGYHCAKRLILMEDEVVPSSRIDKLVSPYPDIKLFRLLGPFPAFKKNSSIFAYVDNEFKALWVGDSKPNSKNKELKIIFDGGYADKVFSPVWNRDPAKDTLYVCMGPSFQEQKIVDICAFTNVSKYFDTDDTDKPPPPPPPPVEPLIVNGYNNAFPSTNPDGTKLVFRSNMNGVNEGGKKYKNLYIMEDAQSPSSEIRRLTKGEWTDTHCQWSPSGDWIVFSSSRDKPEGAPELDNGLDDGYFAVYLVKWDDPSVVVRVMTSGYDIAGHVNHPHFSPDGASIVVTSDLAAVSVDPISLPLFTHSVRPYGDIFTVDIDPSDITKNKDRDMNYITRSTHSRFENSTDTWAVFPDQVLELELIMKLSRRYSSFAPACPYIQSNGGESWHMTGQLLIPVRKC